MIKKLTLIWVVLFITSTHSYAGDWYNQIGISYASGISDVADIYEKNLESSAFVEEVDVTLVPIGGSYSGHYQYDSGLRTGVGLGPLFLVLGDGSHTELPVYASVGWTFLREEKLSPFLSVGMSKHIVSGDYVEGDTPGLLLEAGFTYKKYGIKLILDKSELELETVDGLKTVNSYDTVVTVFTQF